jgi:hypothetical protein
MDETAQNLGMLYTGLLEKRNPSNGSYNNRFVVLTHDFVHWFKRSNEGGELFGEERGHIGLDSILTVRILDEDSTCFEIQAVDHKKTLFRGMSPNISEEWVSAIRSAIKGHSDIPEDRGLEVSVNLVSLKSKADETELVITRNPIWDRIINLPCIKKGDELVISTSNGGSVYISYEMMLLKSDDGIDFEASVQSVPLASSLRLSLRRSLSSTSKNEDRSSPKEASTLTKLIRQMTVFLSTIARNQSRSMTMVLSVMVLLVGIASLPYLNQDTSLFFLFAAILSCHSIRRLFLDTSFDSSVDPTGGLYLALILHWHAFTSNDEPISLQDDEIPKRFIDGCEGALCIIFLDILCLLVIV